MTEPIIIDAPLSGFLAARHTLRFETVADAGTDAPADVTPEPDAVADPDADPAAAAEPDAPAEPEWASSPEYQERLAAEADELARAQIDEMLEEADRQAAMQQHQARHTDPGTADEGQQLPELDPLGDPAEFTQGLAGLVQQTVQAALAPLMPMVEQQQHASIEQFTTAEMDRLASRPEFSDYQLKPDMTPEQQAEVTERRHTADSIAVAYLSHFEDQYGEGSPHAVQAAQRAGMAQLRDFEKAAYDRGRKAREGELQNIAGASDTPPAGGGAAEITDLPDDPIKAMDEVRRRFVERHKAS